MAKKKGTLSKQWSEEYLTLSHVYPINHHLKAQKSSLQVLTETGKVIEKFLTETGKVIEVDYFPVYLE